MSGILLSLAAFSGIGGNDSFTQLLLHGNGANGGTVFTDSSSSARTVTKNGTVTTSTTQSKFGGSSIITNNTAADYLSIADAAALRFGSGDLTIEGQVFLTSIAAANALVNKRASSSTTGFSINVTNTGTLLWSDGSTTQATSATIAINGFHQWMWARSGSTNYLFIDGGTPTTWSNSTNYSDTSALIIGAAPQADTSQKCTGYHNEIRCSVGIARQTSAFTPPSQPYG